MIETTLRPDRPRRGAGVPAMPVAGGAARRPRCTAGTCSRIADLTPEEIVLILDTAEAMKEVGSRAIKKVPALRGRTVVNLFFEPSTRTRTSFEIAEKRLSADTLNIADRDLERHQGRDAGRHRAQPRGDVARHDRDAPRLVRAPATCWRGSVASRIINAGDGMHEHPTQALLDAFTIREHKGRLAGLKVAIVGDLLHSRVLRSNLHLLNKLGAERLGVGAAHADARRHRALRRHRDDQRRRGDRRRRRGDDAAHPDGAHAGPLLPVAARVLHALRADARSAWRWRSPTPSSCIRGR